MVDRLPVAQEMKKFVDSSHEALWILRFLIVQVVVFRGDLSKPHKTTVMANEFHKTITDMTEVDGRKLFVVI